MTLKAHGEYLKTQVTYNRRKIAEFTLNERLWSEYIEQQQELVEVMRDLGYERYTAPAKLTDTLNAQYIYCHDLFCMWMGSPDTYPLFGAY